MEGDLSAAGVLDVLGDEKSRTILAEIAERRRSAKALSEACNVSLPTVYRRLEALTDCGLVAEETQVTDDGNHYNVYVATFERAIVTLSEAGYDVRVVRRGEDGVSGRFIDLWEELNQP